MNKGYLLFTTYDMDEMSATFIPEEHTELIGMLRGVNNQRDMEKAARSFHVWQDLYASTPGYLHWCAQSRCQVPWPFNNVEILGTFYLQVY